MNRSRNTNPKMKKNQKCSSKKPKRSMSLTTSNQMMSHNLRIPLMSIPMTTIITKSCPWQRKWTKKKKSEKLSQRPNPNNHYLNRVTTIKMTIPNLNLKYSKMKIQSKVLKTKMISNQFMTTWMWSNKMPSSLSTKSLMKNSQPIRANHQLLKPILHLKKQKANWTKLTKRIPKIRSIRAMTPN